LPVNWRHYLKERIFAALEELPAHQRQGDGSEVRRAFELAVAEFPQLRPAQAAE
jgi:N-methylhydantoinase B